MPFVDTIPAARDTPYPGTLPLDVDATDTERGIFRVKQTIPVAKTGPMALLYPEMAARRAFARAARSRSSPG